MRKSSYNPFVRGISLTFIDLVIFISIYNTDLLSTVTISR